jgi:hypothetical protein
MYKYTAWYTPIRKPTYTRLKRVGLAVESARCTISSIISDKKSGKRKIKRSIGMQAMLSRSGATIFQGLGSRTMAGKLKFIQI